MYQPVASGRSARLDVAAGVTCASCGLPTSATSTHAVGGEVGLFGLGRRQLSELDVALDLSQQKVDSVTLSSEFGEVHGCFPLVDVCIMARLRVKVKALVPLYRLVAGPGG